jgi:hypothetical protein
MNRLALRVVQLVIAVVFYALIVKLTITGSYNVEHVTLVSRPQDFHIIQENWNTVWWHIYHSLPGSVRNVYLTAFGLAVAAFLYLGFAYARDLYQRQALREHSSWLGHPASAFCVAVRLCWSSPAASSQRANASSNLCWMRRVVSCRVFGRLFRL